MTTVRERVLQEQQRAFKPLLFEVWIDCSMGCIDMPVGWELNSPPKPLHDALDEAAICREVYYYPTRVLPHVDGDREP